MTRKVKCPKCGKEEEFKNNPFRPFCSERCKTSDLGAWAEEAYFIPGDDANLEEELEEWEDGEKIKRTYH